MVIYLSLNFVTPISNSFSFPILPSTFIQHALSIQHRLRIFLESRVLEDITKFSGDPAHRAFLLIPGLLLQRRLSLVLSEISSTHSSLLFSHASVDVDILESNEEGTMRWIREPAVDLPAQIQGDQEWTGQVELEEKLCAEIRPTNRIQSNVELRDEADDVDKQANVGAVNAPSGLVGQFVDRVAIVFPAQRLAMTIS